MNDSLNLDISLDVMSNSRFMTVLMIKVILALLKSMRPSYHLL